MNEYVKDTCKIGQQHLCCRYLVVGSKGFECVKHYKKAKDILDVRVKADSIVAQGDNCSGFDIEESLKKLN